MFWILELFSVLEKYVEREPEPAAGEQWVAQNFPFKFVLWNPRTRMIPSELEKL